MRILIITDLYPPYHKGGYELRCMETADELSRRGHEIIVLTSRWRAENGQVPGTIHRSLYYNELMGLEKRPSADTEAQAVKNKQFFGEEINSSARNRLSRLMTSDPLRFHRRFSQVQWAFKSRKNYAITRELINTVHPDLVYIWNMGFLGLSPVLAAQDQGIPTVFSIGDYWLLQLKTELFDDASHLKKKFRAVITGLEDFSQLDLKHLLVISAVLKDGYARNGFLEENLHVISRGIQSNLILPVDQLGKLPRNQDGQMKLLFVGRIVSDKAPDVAIRAVDILITQYGITNIVLDIVGQGPQEYTSSLESLVLTSKLEKNVRFLGWLEHATILDLYSNYDALLFPSRWVEPLGGTVLEAMARGLPVIASRRGGPLEIINDGENGLLVPADDPAAFARAILQLLQDDDLTQRIRAAGIKTIKERYALERIVDQNLGYFQTILS